jgi:RNA polymerase sigma-70 factor (ECF subfamily)
LDRDSRATSDEELLARFIAGNEQCFTDLMRRHEDRIFSLAYRMTGERADALDATQDAFIAAFRQARAFRGESAFGTWLYRIAINACRDLIRKRRRRESPDEDAAEGAEQVSARRLEDLVVERIDVAQALALLSDEYREAVVMHDLGGIPYEEIARLTETNLGTVKSRISRGRRKLAELLEHPERTATSKDLR